MAKKRQDSDNPQGPKRSGVPLHAWIRGELMDGLRKLSRKNRRTITAELEIALERHLAEGGIDVAPGDQGDE